MARGKPVGRVAPGTSVEVAYVGLRAAIVNGDYQPGAPMRPHEFSKQLGVGLIPIREALRRLEAERLVESIPNKGSRVASISSADLIDVYSARFLLEQEALRLAWPRLTPDVLAKLRDLNARLINDVRQGNPEFYEIHRALHFTIYEQSQSPWLLHMIEILWGHTERYRRLAGHLKLFVDVGDDLHHKVLDTIEAGDQVGATNNLRNDLDRTAQLIIGAYGDADAAK
ncbi:MAG TPA: GntR family transcriptional regulator [Candidatus Nanopelagicaceae bacterium]|nr:GntR family transcriptional regulator [Candidatus Nanopelagicaceae bacterium]